MDQTRIERMKQMLINKLREHGRDTIAVLGKGKELMELISEARKDEGEIAIARVAAYVEAVMAQSVELSARELAQALDRLIANPETFGVCIACGKDIDMSRLKVVPNTHHCRNCVRETRPVRRHV